MCSDSGLVPKKPQEFTSNVASRVFLLCLSIGKRSTGTQREGGMGGGEGRVVEALESLGCCCNWGLFFSPQTAGCGAK